MSGSIRTFYKGRTYRSRLEARWAAFFDLIGWEYEYEPLDLDGWIPDFALCGAKRPILVEVKPVFGIDEVDESVFTKIQQDNYEVLLLGCNIRDKAKNWGDFMQLGWLMECDGYSEEIFHVWDEAWLFNVFGGVLDFCHSSGSWVGRMTGVYDGDRHLDTTNRDQVIGLWGRAGDLVQWKPR